MNTYDIPTLVEAHIELQDLIAIQRARALSIAEPSSEVEARIAELEAILADAEMDS